MSEKTTWAGSGFTAPGTAAGPGSGAPQAAATPGQAERDHAEFTRWFTPLDSPDPFYGPDMAEAFAAGMQAARDLAAQDARPAPLPHGIALAALECIRQAYEPGTMAHDTACKAIDDTGAARQRNAAVDVNDLPVTPAAAALYKLASRWWTEAFRLGRLLDQKHPRALALEDCSTALRSAVNGLRRDGDL